MNSPNRTDDLNPEPYHIPSERDLKRQFDQMRTLLEMTKAVASHLSIRELFAVIADSLTGIIECDAAGMTLLDGESGQLRAYALEIRPEHRDRSFPVHEGILLPMEDLPSAQAIQARRTLLFTHDDLLRLNSPFMRQAVAGGIRSGCAAPLISRGKALGTIDIVSLRENMFTSDDAWMLTQIANQIAVAVDNALNFERAKRAEREAERERDHWRLMLDVNNAVVSHLDLTELVKTVSGNLAKLMPLEAAGIALHEKGRDHLRVYFLTDRFIGSFRPGDTFPIDGTPQGQVFTTGVPMVMGRPDFERFPADAPFQSATGRQSCCIVPLIAHGRKLGIMGIGSALQDAFSEADLELLTHISHQVAIAVDNALNFERAREAERQAERERDRLRFLLEVNNAVVTHLDLKDLVASVSTLLRDLMPLEAAAIALYEPEHNHMRMFVGTLASHFKVLREGDIVQLEGTPAGLVFASGEPLLLKRPDPERFPGDKLNQPEGGRKSGCLIPLVSRGRILGILGIASTKENAFTEAHLDLLSMISGQVAIAVENALAFREIEALKNKLAQEKLYLEEELQNVWNFEEIIGVSPAFKRILKQVETVAPIDSTVLIYGETGTGKEIIARAIHNLSTRRGHSLVKLNCAAIPTGLLESELFGHEKGAFTGAIAARAGRFELAHRGTFLLDEIGEIPTELQPKLLRVLQEQEFERLGSTRTQKVNVRLLAATNRDLAHMVEQNQFRRDLYYRLNVFPITIPPLRERPEDIPLLVRYFASKFSHRMGKRIETIPTEAMRTLTAYHWPGNIRELENFIERATILTTGSQLDVPLSELKSKAPPDTPSTPVQTLEDTEREHILRVLRQTDWVVGGPNGAAARLGMKRTTLQSKMLKLGIMGRKG